MFCYLFLHNLHIFSNYEYIVLVLIINMKVIKKMTEIMLLKKRNLT